MQKPQESSTNAFKDLKVPETLNSTNSDEMKDTNSNSESGRDSIKTKKIQRTGTIPLDELDDEGAEKDVQYRLDSSSTILEIAAVLGLLSSKQNKKSKILKCSDSE